LRKKPASAQNKQTQWGKIGKKKEKEEKGEIKRGVGGTIKKMLQPMALLLCKKSSGKQMWRGDSVRNRSRGHYAT